MVGPLFAQTAWTNVTFIGSEVRDPGKTWCARCRRVRGCGRTLCFGEHWLSGGAAVSGNPARATKPRSHSDDGRRFRSARRDVHGRRDHDFHFRLRQWPDSCSSGKLQPRTDFGFPRQHS